MRLVHDIRRLLARIRRDVPADPYADALRAARRRRLAIRRALLRAGHVQHPLFPLDRDDQR